MAAILQTTFSNPFSCREIVVFWFKFYCNEEKPLFEIMVVQHTDTYMHTSAAMSSFSLKFSWSFWRGSTPYRMERLCRDQGKKIAKEKWIAQICIFPCVISARSSRVSKIVIYVSVRRTSRGWSELARTVTFMRCCWTGEETRSCQLGWLLVEN